MHDDKPDYYLFGLAIPDALGEWLEEALAVSWAARLAWIMVGLLLGCVAVLAGLWTAYT